MASSTNITDDTVKMKKIRYSSIPWRTLLGLAWRNISNKKLRTALTVAGVIIGIGAIYFMISFGLGLQRLVTNRIIGSQSLGVIDVSSPSTKVLKLNQKIFERIRAFPHIKSAGGSFSFAGSVKRHGSEISSVVYGSSIEYIELANLDVDVGRKLTKSDNREVVVSKALLQSIGVTDPKSFLGSKITLTIPLRGSQTTTPEITGNFTVVGVLATGTGSEVMIPDHIFQLAGVTEYTQVKVEADANENIQDVRNKIEALGFPTSSPLDTVDQINQVFKFVNLVAVGFGAIGMIVAVLGMFNTLTISLLERTKEIGLMIALGGRRSDMRKLFIFEAMILSVMGAAGGLLLAIILGNAVDIGMGIYTHSRGITETYVIFAYDPLIAIGMVIFMMIVGLAVVYFPARRAERINPIDALRRE